MGHTGLVDALLKQVRDETSLDVKRADFKLDMVPPHLFMNFRVVDEHGRQLGQGRSLSALKAELGAKARGAFQALASLKIAPGAGSKPDLDKKQSENKLDKAQAAPEKRAKQAPTAQAEARYTAWTFGELPELMEIGKGGQTLIGFPALIDAGDAVTIEVFDEPEVAAAKHRAGLRRLCALQIRDALKYLEKEPARPAEDGRGLYAAGYPGRAAQPDSRCGDGPGVPARTLAYQCGAVRAPRAGRAGTPDLDRQRSGAPGRHHSCRVRRSSAQDQGHQKRPRGHAGCAGATAAPGAEKNFLTAAPWPQLAHFARYLKAITARLDKLRADPARDAAKLAELRPQEQRYWRLVAERKGAVDARMQELRWLLEELRVSFFAQELRTPQPVSVKRLDKLWAQINH